MSNTVNWNGQYVQGSATVSLSSSGASWNGSASWKGPYGVASGSASGSGANGSGSISYSGTFASGTISW